MSGNSTTLDSDLDELLLQDEPEDEGPLAHAGAWKLLIVDDDDSVHTATHYALGNVQILGRPLEFHHAYSAKEAYQLLEQQPDIAVILLDVVMETDDAGLKLVEQIRQQLRLDQPRIILRTGQPGYAPELDVIRDYDINDYKTKAELTRTKLYTSLTTALRAYTQLQALEANRRGLRQIVDGSAALTAAQSLELFANELLEQLRQLIGGFSQAVICSHYSDRDPSYRLEAIENNDRSLAGRPLSTLDNPDLEQRILSCFERQQHQFEDQHLALYFSSKSGADLCAQLQLKTPLDDTSNDLLAVFCSKVSVCLDNISLFSSLKSQAFFDPLLQLPNRNHLIKQIDDTSQQADFAQQSVLLIDIDHFAELNHALGHQYGDLLLSQVSLRLIDFCQQDQFLARITGDTFAIFGPSSSLKINSLPELFIKPFDIDGHQQAISATFGIAQMSEVDGCGHEAIKAASTALNQAKQDQRGQVGVYSREMGNAIQTRVRLLQDLRASFEQERLFLNYQPQVTLAEGRPIGCEALIRWRDDEGRFIPPDTFIPLAERSGIITSIGEWVMRTAFAQAAQLHRIGFSDLRMSVNVSMIQFRADNFLQVLDRALADTRVTPQLVELEITESVAMLEADYMVNLLEQIKERGVQVAIDDFGTGFSSLSYLQKLKINRLKIDRAFVDQICHSEDANNIAEMVIKLGRSLNLQVTAEGIEDQQQAERLNQLGCQEAQGFYYARPMSAEALTKWLQQQPQG